jgi:prepilin-type N-terminal cleavage/methylation domain-containing protein
MSMARHQRRMGALLPGFTLIEILVVVVILGIAAAIVVPAIGSRNDLKATSAARIIVADLIYAQNRSISQQKRHYVRFDLTDQKYEVFEEDQTTGALTLITHPVEASPFVVNLGESGPKPIRDVRLDTASFDGKTMMAFDELGTPFAFDEDTTTLTAMTNGQIRLACGDLRLTVIVEPFSGELRLVEGGGP